MPAGRPTKYEPDWMLSKVIEVMKVGGSKVEVACELGIDRDTLYEWAKDPEKTAFSDTIKRGEALCQMWWERVGRIGLVGNKDQTFNASVWIFNMKNRFREDWKDKQETEHSGNMQVNWPLGRSKLDE